VPIHAPFRDAFEIKTRKRKFWAVLSLSECNNLGLTSYESNSVELASASREQNLGHKQKKTQLSQRDRATLYASTFHEVWQFERFQSAKVTFKVIQRHGHWCHSIDHIQFPISLPLQLCLYFAPLTRYYHLFTKI